MSDPKLRTPELPLPVAALLRAAAGFTAVKARHDTMCDAWEASVRIAVAADPPRDLGVLVRPSVGAWVAAMRRTDDSSEDSALLEAFALFTREGDNQEVRPRRVSSRRLLEVLPPYRNRVVGHGGVRSDDYYSNAADTMQAGLLAAWRAGMFLSSDARVVFPESVDVDAAGVTRARVVDLMGDSVGRVRREVTCRTNFVLRPNRVHLLETAGFRPLSPWLVLDVGALGERLLYLDALNPSARYYDFGTGDVLRATEVASRVPGLDQEVAALIASIGSERGPTRPWDADDAESGDQASSRTPLVFVSAKSEDYVQARPVVAALRERGVRVFFAEDSIAAGGSSDYGRAVSSALDECRHFVLVVSSPSHAESRWVEAEWRMFVNELRAGRKDGNVVVVTLGDVGVARLPIDLRMVQVVPWRGATAADELSKFLRR
jgi:hypothetical protein